MISYKINHLLCYFASWNSVKGKTFFISCEILSFHWNRRNAFVGDAFQWIENLCHKLFLTISWISPWVYIYLLSHIFFQRFEWVIMHIFVVLMCFVCGYDERCFPVNILYIKIFCQGPDPRFLVIEIKVKQ